MKVVTIKKDVADLWISTKHYSRRPSIFWKAFGLLIDDKIEGVVVYGQPSPSIQRYAFHDRTFKMYELCRLVIQTKKKNAASFLVANSLKMLEKPCAVVSYSDMEYQHCGFIYQATNWLYTGQTKSHDHTYIVDGERLHAMTIRDKFGVTKIKAWAKENGIETVRPCFKHRYFYLCGNKTDKKTMLGTLRYDVIAQYPKANPKRYDDGNHIDMDYIDVDDFVS